MSEIVIIDKPEVRTSLRRCTEWFITVVMWGLWAYLLMPLFSVLLWFFGIRLFYRELIEKCGYQFFLDLVVRGGVLVLIVMLIILSWGYYNLFMFGRSGRRRYVRQATTADLAGNFQVSPSQVRKMQRSQVVHWSGPVKLEKSILKRRRS